MVFRRRKPGVFITPEDVAKFIEEGARPVDFAEVFGREFSAADQEALEAAFGDAAIAVVIYLKGLSTAEARRSPGALYYLVDVISKAEFNLRFRPEFDRAVVETWRDDAIARCAWDSLAPDENVLAEAHKLVADGWYAICTLVTARMDPALEVDNGPIEFLRAFFGEPSVYRESFVDV